MSPHPTEEECERSIRVRVRVSNTPPQRMWGFLSHPVMCVWPLDIRIIVIVRVTVAVAVIVRVTVADR